MKLSRQKVFKALLSVFIVFHLVCVFVLPNPDSILYRNLASVVVTYGSFFGFNTTWRFFSPNPMIRVMDYEVFKRDESGELRSQKFQYPPPLSDGGERENFNRKLTNAMYMMMRQDFLQDIIGPRICSWHPGAETIAVSMRGRILPSMEKSKFESDVREELGEISTQYLTDIDCQKETEE